MDPSVAECVSDLRKYYTSLSWLHSHPFSWPATSSAPVKRTDLRTQIHWHINVHLTVGYSCFVVYRTLQSYNVPSVALEQKLYLAFMSLLYACVGFLSVFMLIKCDDFIQFQRSHVKFIREGHVQNLKELAASKGHGGAAKKFKLLLRTIFYAVLLETVGIFALNVLYPTSPEFLSSLFLIGNSSCGPLCIAFVVLPSSLFQAYILTCFVPVVTIWSGHFYLFTFSIAKMLRAQEGIRLRTSSDDGSSANVHKTWLRSTLRLHKCLSPHINWYNDVTGTVNGLVHANTVALIVLYVYGAVRMNGVMAFASAYLGLVGFVTHCTTVNSYAEIDRTSKALLVAAQRAGSVQPVADRGGRDETIKREVKSMNPLRIKAGSAFYYDKQLVLTIIEIILVQSINLLTMW